MTKSLRFRILVIVNYLELEICDLRFKYLHSEKGRMISLIIYDVPNFCNLALELDFFQENFSLHRKVGRQRVLFD